MDLHWVPLFTLFWSGELLSSGTDPLIWRKNPNKYISQNLKTVPSEWLKNLCWVPSGWLLANGPCLPCGRCCWDAGVWQTGKPGKFPSCQWPEPGWSTESLHRGSPSWSQSEGCSGRSGGAVETPTCTVMLHNYVIKNRWWEYACFKVASLTPGPEAWWWTGMWGTGGGGLRWGVTA